MHYQVLAPSPAIGNDGVLGNGLMGILEQQPRDTVFNAATTEKVSKLIGRP